MKTTESIIGPDSNQGNLTTCAALLVSYPPKWQDHRSVDEIVRDIYEHRS